MARPYLTCAQPRTPRAPNGIGEGVNGTPLPVLAGAAQPILVTGPPVVSVQAVSCLIH
jgi:hypothetical protein